MNIIVFNITHSINYPPPPIYPNPNPTPPPPNLLVTKAACRMRFFFLETKRPWNFGHVQVSESVNMGQNGSKWETEINTIY